MDFLTCEYSSQSAWLYSQKRVSIITWIENIKNNKIKLPIHFQNMFTYQINFIGGIMLSTGEQTTDISACIIGNM